MLSDELAWGLEVTGEVWRWEIKRQLILVVFQSGWACDGDQGLGPPRNQWGW